MGSVPGLVDAIFHSQQPKPGKYFASGVCMSILLQFIGWVVVRAYLALPKRGT